MILILGLTPLLLYAVAIWATFQFLRTQKPEWVLLLGATFMATGLNHLAFQFYIGIFTPDRYAGFMAVLALVCVGIYKMLEKAETQ